MNDDARAEPAAPVANTGGLPELPHFKPKAKRIIYLFQSGAPSQLDPVRLQTETWQESRGTDLPESVRMGQRLTGMTANQTSFPICPSMFKFAQHGKSGAWLSELLPHLAKTVDEMCIVKSLHTEAINHDPAITFITTGAQLAGRPSIGSWMSYGLGSENRDLPGLRRHDLPRHRSSFRSASVRSALGQRLSARRGTRG